MLTNDLPSPQELNNQALSSKVFDRNGKLLFRFYHNQNRTAVSLANISPYLINATIAIEDQDFYHHHGFSIAGILRSVLRNLTANKALQGGSTITQQLVKNRLLTSEKTYLRKIREIILAIQVESRLTKDQILELYLNEIAFGGINYGVEEAAWFYFDKPASDLNLAESAFLAGLPQAPSRYNPRKNNPELAYQRMNLVLKKMQEEHFISEEDYLRALGYRFAFNQKKIHIKAPHFVMYIKKLLLEKYTEEQLYHDGLRIKTTLDLALHTKVQDIVTANVDKLFRLQVSNGAALVTVPKTGEILSMVGSKDYFDLNNDGNVNVVLSLRQPGSSIKPLTYAMSIEQGKSPQSNLLDTAEEYTIGGALYTPGNYDNQFRGQVSLREALANSYNLPAVKELAQIGVVNYINKAKTLGINSWDHKNKYDVGLTLGSGEVRMLDMAQLYSAFANDGYDVPLNPIIEIKNNKGDTLYRNPCILDHVACYSDKKFNTRTIVFLTDILADNKSRSKIFGLESDLYIPGHEVAVKTGTTNDYRDNWTIGYTNDYIAAVWTGNNNNTPMRFIHSGRNGASTIWKQMMGLLLDDNKPHRFEIPEGFIKLSICEKTGTLPCSSCSDIIEEIFVKGTEPQSACTDYDPASFDGKGVVDNYEVE